MSNNIWQIRKQSDRVQYAKLENQTAAYLTKNFHMDGDKFVSKIIGSEDAVNEVGAILLTFMASFASNLLLVLVFLTFMLVDDQLNDGATCSDVRFQLFTPSVAACLNV